MKTLYLDCGMGAAGDMLTAALLELLPEPDAFLAELNALGLPGVEYRRESSVKCGVTGTHISVLIHGAPEHEHHHHHKHEHEHEHAHDHDHVHDHDHDYEHHHHTGMHDISAIIEGLALPERVRSDILAVYGHIAAAESAVHGVPVTDIHFHEVGSLDAVADVTAVCLLMDRLAPDEVVVSPVHVGSGQVHCAHGILPVPAPATAEILKGVPIYGGEIDGELCTPTGAALLRHFAARFSGMPVMRVSAIGYGMGHRDFPRANCVRALLGESGDAADTIAVLSCNVDDMTAEEIGHAMERLLDAGARDVFTVPIGMKKNRPGTLIRVLCVPGDRDKMTALLFRHTTTIGVRAAEMDRYILNRTTETVQTPYGDVRRKIAVGCGVRREKFEYDDLARIAKEQDMSLAELRDALERN